MLKLANLRSSLLISDFIILFYLQEPDIDVSPQPTTLQSAFLEEAILLEQQRALSQECAEAVLTSTLSDLTENVIMSDDDKLDENDDKENNVDMPPIVDIPSPG